MPKKAPSQSTAAKLSTWTTLLSSGAVVAAITFGAPKLWGFLKHKPASIETVRVVLRVEGSRVMIFARNSSDEVVDFTSAAIAISDARLASTKIHGAFPEVSQVYVVKGPYREAYSITIMDDALVFKLGIAQSIAPAGADQFGFEIESALEQLQINPEFVSVELTDMKGQRYAASKS